MSYRPEIGDVLAATDVLADVTEVSDSLTPEEAVEFRVACEKVQAAAKLAIDMLNQHLVSVLDGQPSIERDGFVYYIGPKTEKEVVDHAAVAGHVAGIALDTADEMNVSGSEPLPSELIFIGAKVATQVFRDLYLSDSTRVKKGQLDRYGIPRSVIDVQRGSKEVKRVPV